MRKQVWLCNFHYDLTSAVNPLQMLQLLHRFANTTIVSLATSILIILYLIVYLYNKLSYYRRKKYGSKRQRVMVVLGAGLCFSLL